AVWVPSSWLQLVDRLVEAGRYRSRSEAVRAAIEGLIAQHKCKFLKSAEVRGT
ncbi:MAG: ribbon-helix-helix domain-containing protein, partial [Pyrobaculum sp.]